MPFAPIVLKSEYNKYFYKKIEKTLINSKFMTMTFDCKKKIIRSCTSHSPCLTKQLDRK